MSKKKSRLLLVVDYFYPHWTGISKSIYYLVCLMHQDFDITVLTIRHAKNLKKEETVLSAKIVREDYIFSINRSKYSINQIIRFTSLAKHHDIIFLNSPCANVLPLSLISKIFNKKLIILHHGDLILPNGITNRLIEKIFDVSSFASFSLADKISTFTKDYAKHSRILKYYLSKFQPIIIPPPKKLTSQKQQRNKKLKVLQKLEKDKILFGMVGRFVEEKGFDILFDAIPSIIKSLPNAHFIFAGQTKIPYENFYKKTLPKLKKIKKYITFLGLLNDKELSQFYKAIAFIILPSRSDCFPLAQVEAVLSETPSIVSDIPGARTIVKKTGFGLYFKKEDSNDLASVVISAPSKRESILEHYPKVLQLLDLDKNVKTIKEFIEK